MSMELRIEPPYRKPTPEARRRTERAWVYRADPPCLASASNTRKLSFVEFTRYYRWYTTTRRSEILLKIEREKPGYFYRHNPDEWYPKWPRHLV